MASELSIVGLRLDVLHDTAEILKRLRISAPKRASHDARRVLEEIISIDARSIS